MTATRGRRRVVLALLVALVVGPAIVGERARALPLAPVDPCSWTSFRNGLHNRGASDCAAFDRSSIAELRPSWVYRTRDSVTATPAVVGGRVYVGAWDGTFYAFDEAQEGIGDPSLPEVSQISPRWTFTIDDTNGVSFGRIVSSATVTEPLTVGRALSARHGRLVLFTGGATLYILAADDRDLDGVGDLIAKICLDPRREEDTTSGRCRGTAEGQVEAEASPVVIQKDPRTLRVLVGTDVHNDPNVGRTGVTAVDFDLPTLTLTPAWKYDPEGAGIGDPDGETYRPATHGDVVTFGSGTGDGCGGVWGTPAVDVERDVVVLGISSCRLTSPDGPDDVPGEKVDAIRLSDGGFRWRFSPPRPWGSRTDDDFGASPQLFAADVDGDGVKEPIAGAGGKDGSYYAMHAVSGAPLWASHPGQSGHTYEDFAIGGVLGSPAVGEVDGRPLIFVTTAISTPIGAPVDYGTAESLDGSLLEDPLRMLSLHAIDGRSGAVVWRQLLARQTYAHPTFANGLVYVPSTVGLALEVFDAASGLPVWGSPVGGPPSSGVAITATGIYLGVGTRQTDAGFKLSGTDSSVPQEVQAVAPPLVEDVVGSDPQERVAGVWAFRRG